MAAAQVLPATRMAWAPDGRSTVPWPVGAGLVVEQPDEAIAEACRRGWARRREYQRHGRDLPSETPP